MAGREGSGAAVTPRAAVLRCVGESTYTALVRIKDAACVPVALHARRTTPGSLLKSLGDYHPTASSYGPRPATLSATAAVSSSVGF